MDSAAPDPKGLIRESYRIEGIRPEECRAIFLDWALSISEDMPSERAIRELLALYAPDNPDHVMTGVLRDGLAGSAPPVRRGGRAGRLGRP